MSTSSFSFSAAFRSYELSDASPDDAATGTDASVGVFSGGSLLLGATGRPDLLGEEHTDALAREPGQ